MKRSTTLFLTALVGCQLFVPCRAQMWNTGPGGNSQGSQTQQMPPMSAPQTPPTPRFDPPRIPVVPRTPTNPTPPLNPRDVVLIPTSMESSTDEDNALAGIKHVQNFPAPDELKGSGEGILVKFTPGTVFSRPGETAVAIEQGALLVSVRKPTKIGLIESAVAEASVGANAEILVSYLDGIFRLTNLTGHGENVKIRLKEPIGAVKTISLKPGYEFLVGDRPLRPADLRAADNLARRRCKPMEDGRIAICEVSVDSALQSCELVANLNREESQRKSMRILSDMSKMAAVLNYVRGGEGFRAEPQVTLEVKSQVAAN